MQCEAHEESHFLIVFLLVVLCGLQRDPLPPQLYYEGCCQQLNFILRLWFEVFQLIVIQARFQYLNELVVYLSVVVVQEELKAQIVLEC